MTDLSNASSGDPIASISAAIIEPVGSHGGMDYYDTGLCLGLIAAGATCTWYTCDISSPRGNAAVAMSRTFNRIWGKDPAWKRGLRYVIGLLRTLRLAFHRNERIVHFHFFHVGVLELLSVALSRLFGRHVVSTIHDVEAFRPGRHIKLIQRLSYGLCARLIVHNQVSYDELLEKSRVPADKVRIVPHGSYLGLVDPAIDKKVARTAIGLEEEERVILFFGQIKEVKGLDLLIEAFAKALPAIGPARLVIAGKEWKSDFAKYQTLIDRYGLGDASSLHIRYIADDQVASFYSAADLVVLPYRKIYQSGVLLMAMSFGTPVLASDLPGMTEIVRDGENGFLFKANDAADLSNCLVAAFSDGERLKRVVGVARSEMDTRYSWISIGNRTVQVYHEALSKK